jgi:hypothetical protein
MKFNEKNAIISNVLTEQEISFIYSVVENTKTNFVVKKYGQTVSDFDLPDPVKERVIFHSEQISGETDLEIAEYQFARYKKLPDEDSGQTIMPILTPHWDTFPEPRFTFDYQIGGNTTWPLVVEEKEFVLNNNSALTFSGTHQVHWRTPKVFSENEYLDMIFFHLRKKGSEAYPSTNSIIMEDKVKKYMLIYSKESLNDKN